MFNVANSPHEKVYCVQFCCLTEQQDFTTTETFANYGR